jgi:hypothetical protein
LYLYKGVILLLQYPFKDESGSALESISADPEFLSFPLAETACCDGGTGFRKY